MSDWEGFEVEGVLGAGTTGTVSLARQLSLGRLVAIKELAPELAGDPEVRVRLRQEAQVLASLDDSNCVAVYSFLESGSAAAIVMEYVDGVSLRTLAERSPLSVEQALSVLEGALGGLASAHDHGIVHGDLKPENILLSKAGESKLVDFGLAAAVGTRREPGTGSPTYSSPEAAAGEPLGIASDLYSMGLVLFELLTGDVPAGGGAALGDGAATSTLPAPVAALVRSALDPDPAARPANATVFLENLRAAAAAGCGSDWRRRAVIAPLVVAATTGAVTALGAAKAGAATPPQGAGASSAPAAASAAKGGAKATRVLSAHPWLASAAAIVVVAAAGFGVVAAMGGGSAPQPAVVPTTTRASAAPSVTTRPSASAASKTSTSPIDLANATLPAGMCDPSMPAVTLSNGGGTTGTNQFSPGYYGITLLAPPLSVDISHDGVADTVAEFRCDAGGTLQWTSMWIFDSKSGALTTLAGPIYPRSVGTGPWGALIKSVTLHGSDLVVDETYSNPQDPHCCFSGATTTTWAWHGSTLRIVSPPPSPGTISVAAAPGTIGYPGTKTLPAGTHVAVVCSAVPVSQTSSWTELDTGEWLPSADVTASSTLPDCDVNPVSTGGGTGSSTASGTATAPSCPTAAQLMAVWRANPGTNVVAPGTVVSNLGNVSCWKNWVLAFAVSSNGNGNGSFTFSQLGGLHSLSSAEGSQFSSEVCGDPTSPAGWRGELGC